MNGIITTKIKIIGTALFILMMNIGFIYSVQAQQAVSGTITDQENEPLIGVNVLVKGSNQGTSTDFDGTFMLEKVKENAVLVVSYVGFESQEIPINGRHDILVKLKSDSKLLDEVVVVGYGTQSKRDLTGSVSQVKGGLIENQPNANAATLLNGRSAGVQVTSNNGTPGGGATVRIRGNTSLNSGNDPLYVVDGVPTGDISAFNPNDIESIDILKDASATAIYGARAANGVVLITTKRGEIGKTTYSFNVYTGLQEVARKLPMMNAEQQYNYVVKGNENYNRIFPENNREIRPSHTADYQAGYDTDWQDEIFRVAPIQNYDFGIRSGKENLKFAFGLNYYNQTGVMISSGYERFNGKFNFDLYATDKIRFGASFIASRENYDRIPNGDDEFSVLGNTVRKLAYEPVYEPDGSYSIRERPNPVAQALETHSFDYGNKFLGSTYFEVDILKDLMFKTFLAGDYSGIDRERFKPSFILGGTTRPATASGGDNVSWLIENTLTYNKNIANNHRISALLGYSAQESKFSSFSATGSLGATDKIYTLNAAAVAENVNSSKTSWGISSIFSRINYSLMDKYLLTFNLRRDGSSRFGSANKFAIFPSGSLGWRISDENFFNNIKVINELKFRLSYGKTGNQAIGNFSSQGVYSTGADYAGDAGVRVGSIPVDNLSWESTNQFNAGIDLKLLNQRISINADAYIKQTDGLLFSVPLPSTTGFGSSLQNLGKIENKGIELTFNVDVINSNEFTWNSNFNISFNKNSVVELPDGKSLINSYSTGTYYSVRASYLTQENFPIGMFYGYKWTGDIYATDEAAQQDVSKIVGRTPIGGTFRYEDVSGPDGVPDGKIDAKDRQLIGNPQPDFFGGFNNVFNYKNFNLSLFLQYSFGNEIFNQNRMTSDRGFVYNAATTDQLDAWGEPGQITSKHKAWAVTDQMDNQFSSAWIEDGSYLRIKNVNFSYNFPQRWLENLHISNTRIYFTAHNLFTFTEYSGFDPEVNTKTGNVRTFGVDLGAYPQVRSYMLGINLNF